MLFNHFMILSYAFIKKKVEKTGNYQAIFLHGINLHKIKENINVLLMFNIGQKR